MVNHWNKSQKKDPPSSLPKTNEYPLKNRIMYWWWTTETSPYDDSPSSLPKTNEEKKKQSPPGIWNIFRIGDPELNYKPSWMPRLHPGARGNNPPNSTPPALRSFSQHHGVPHKALTSRHLRLAPRSQRIFSWQISREICSVDWADWADLTDDLFIN